MSRELPDSPDAGWIQTYTGRAFWPLKPKPEDVCIEDIAHSLSLTCRFTGHCQQMYSVGQHSVLISENVPSEHALWGLMHDAAEAYLADIARPIKRMLSDFAEIEERVLFAIAERFGMTWPVPKIIKHWDNVLLATERRDLMSEPPYKWISVENVQPLDEGIYPWCAVESESRFLERFRSLTGVRPTE